MAMDRETALPTAKQVEELWTPPVQSAEVELCPSMRLLAGVWNERRRAAVIEVLTENG